MKILEKLLILISVFGFLGTAGMAVFAIGTLIFKNPSTVVAVAASTIIAGETQAGTAPITVAADATISVSDGEKIFKKCKACHTVNKGGAAKAGPNLWGIVEQDIASAEGFKYSKAMRGFADNKNWSSALLNEFLTKPKTLVKGTKMSFSGLKKEADRLNLIAFLGQQSDTPLSLADLGFVSDATGTENPTGTTVATAPVEQNSFVAGYSNPPARTDAKQAEIDALVAALAAQVKDMDYERARYHPLHFPPQINQASNEECLVCHAEITGHKPRDTSPAGLPASSTKAWYQTLATYDGKQASFHYRHLESDYAKSVMNLECTFCHKGNDPRAESPDMMRGRPAYSASATPEFTLRKMVNPSTTCLLCHGAMPNPEEIMGLSGPWPEARQDFEDEETLNGCLSCHGEDGFRTNRHNVTYLNAANIEDLATASSDVCSGCHGGRQWYRISYPYPRHPWPGMDEETPDWALNRSTESDPKYQRASEASK